MGNALRRIIHPVRDALMEGRLTLVLVVAVMATAIGLLAPIDSLHSGGEAHRLSLPLIPESDAPVRWTESALGPSATQAKAVDDLLTVLLVLGWTALVIGAVTVLTRYIARATRIAAEIGVRRAVGASRRDIVLALLGEVLVTAAAAILLGTLIGTLAAQVAARAWPGSITAGLPWSGWAALASIAAIGLGGLLAMGFVREEHLRHQDEGQVNLQVPAVQLGFSLAIIMSSSLLTQRGTEVRQGGARAAAPSGLLVQIDTGTSEPARRAQQFGVLLDQAERSIPGSQASLTAPGDFLGLGMLDLVTTDCGQCSRAGIFIRYIHINSVYRFVSPDSFQAGGVAVIEGRGFSREDSWQNPRVAVVNRHMARRHFQNGQPVGRDLYLGTGWPRQPYRIIGVVDDRPARSLGSARQPYEAVYLSVLQFPPRTVELLIRPAAGAVGRDAVRNLALQSLGSQISAGPVRTEAEALGPDRRSLAWFGVWFGGAGGVILLAGIAGTFGLVAMWVRSMAHEIAVRRALGATRRRILFSVLRRAVGIGLGGIGVGLFLFFVVFREVLRAQLTGLPVWQAGVFYGAALMLIGVTLLAAFLPAWRIVREQPAGLMN